MSELQQPFRQVYTWCRPVTMHHDCVSRDINMNDLIVTGNLKTEALCYNLMRSILHVRTASSIKLTFWDSCSQEASATFWHSYHSSRCIRDWTVYDRIFNTTFSLRARRVLYGSSNKFCKLHQFILESKFPLHSQGRPCTVSFLDSSYTMVRLNLMFRI